MRMGLGLGLTAAQSSGGSVDPDAAIAAILLGTPDFAIDYTNTANLFQTAGGTGAVTAPADPVGHVNSQWGNTAYSWQQSTSGSRPAYDGSGVAYDGIASHFNAFSSPGFTNTAPALSTCHRLEVASLATAMYVFGWSNSVVTQSIHFLRINTDGSINFSVRRLNGGTQSFANSAAGIVTAGVPITIFTEADYNGTGVARVWADGALVATQAIADGVGLTSATDAARMRDGADLANTPAFYFSGTKFKALGARRTFSDSDRATIEAWAVA